MTDEADQEVEYIRKMLDHGDFTEIHEMIKYWKALKSFGIFAGAIRRIVIGTAVLLGAVMLLNDTAREGLSKWLGR